MLAELVLGGAVAAGAGSLPSLEVALTLLRRHAEGAEVKEVGPIPLAGFNFYRSVGLGSQWSALVISTLWESGVLLYDDHGRGVDYMAMSEVMRLWAIDLDGDGTMELLTDERVGRGTGVQVCEFRLYRAAGQLRRIWSGESYLLEAPSSPEGVRVMADRRSFIRILSAPTPHLEYRQLCGLKECIKELFVQGDRVVEH